MQSRSGATAYRRVDLESSPNYQIVDRLYERFARDMERARAAILAKDIHAKARELDHGLQIVVQLKVALDGLSEDHRQVLVLRFLMEKSAREIGDIMGRKEVTIRGLQMRALQALRKEIETMGGLP